MSHHEHHHRPHDDGAPLVPVATHLARVLAEATPLPAREVDLIDSRGHRLADDVAATLAVPPWDNSAMDGYAVRYDDVATASPDAPVTLRIVADLPAGSADDPALANGETARIMTGATMPTDADTVVQLEHTDRDDPAAPLAETVTVRRAPTRGMHVRRAGEDRRPGDPVVARGTLVTGAVAAALASTGHPTVAVRPVPRVLVIATGSELVRPGEPLGRGQIPDSNSLLIAGLVAEAGGELAGLKRVADDPAELRAAILTGTARCGRRPHVVILTGGVSQGAYDPVKQAFAGSDTVEFVRVGMQPGKPQAFGRFGYSPDHDDTEPGSRGPLLFGLPGNPVSAWVSFHVFVRPALLALAGAPPETVTPAPSDAVVQVGWRTPGGRDQYLPARITDDGARTLVTPVAALGSKSHLAASLAGANGYAIVPASLQASRGGAPIEPGDVVPVVRLAVEAPPLLTPTATHQPAPDRNEHP